MLSTAVVLSYIRKMSPEARRKELRELLAAMTPIERAEAHGVLHGIDHAGGLPSDGCGDGATRMQPNSILKVRH